MRYFILAILTILAVFLNTTVLTAMSYLYASPDLLIFIVVFFAIYNGPEKGLICGLAIGFAEDLLTGAYLGMNALGKGLAGFAAGRAQAGFYEDNVMYGLVNVSIGSVVNAAVILIVNIINSHLICDWGLVWSLGLQAVENIALAIPLYFLFAVVRQNRLMKRLWEES